MESQIDRKIERQLDIKIARQNERQKDRLQDRFVLFNFLLAEEINNETLSENRLHYELQTGNGLWKHCHDIYMSSV